MNFKKFISGVSAFTIAASAFAGMAVTASAAEGDVTNLATVNFDDGTLTGMTATGIEVSSDNRILIRNGSGTITVDDSKIGAKDKVEVKFQLAFGKLSGKKAYFEMKDADNDTIASLSCIPYAGSIDTNLGVTWDYMYRGANEPLWDRCVNFDIVIDYMTKKITTKTSCYLSGSGKAATTGEFTVDLPSDAGALKTFVIGADYNTSDATAGRRCQADNFTIDAIEGPAVQTYDITTNYVDEDGNAVKAPTTTAVAEGETYTPSYDATFDDDNYRYTFVKCTSIESVTEAASVQVVYSKAELADHTVTVTATGDYEATLGTYTVKDAKSATYTFSKYILDGTTLYSTGTSGTNDWYKKTVSNVTDNVVSSHTYTSALTDVVYYADGADAAGLTAATTGYIPIRCSNATGGYAESDATITTLPAGKYKITIAPYGNAGITFKAFAGSTDSAALVEAATSGNTKEITSEEFTLTEATDIIIGKAGNAGSSPKVIDYIYIVKTGDVEVQPDDTNTATYTFDNIESWNDMTLHVVATNGTETKEGEKSLSGITTISGQGGVNLAVVITEIPEGVSITRIYVD